MARRCRANVELEALWVSVALVRDSVLGDSSELSSLAAPLAWVPEEVENRINTAAANGVRSETRSTLVVVLSHFPKLELKLELLRFRRDADQSDDRADALWPLVSMASDSLTSLVPSSLVHNPPDDAE
jgi:hypothetical protein